MNVPGIRKALENLEADSIRNGGFDGEVPVSCIDPTISAVVRVGLRACDECERLNGDDHGIPCIGEARRLRAEQEAALEVIADILREAGVEVEG